MERLLHLLNEYDKYRKQLNELKITKTQENFLAVSMLQFTSFNLCIDIASLFLMKKYSEIAQTYGEIFERFKKKNFIDEKEHLCLKKMVKVRNTLSHRYHEVEEKIIWNALKNVVPCVDSFISKIKKKVVK